MLIFFDTEFTGLHTLQKGLISIGCITTDGREFYAELTDTWDDHMCSMFTLNTVLPLLQGGEYRMGVDELAVRLKAWIEGLTDDEVVFHSDSPTFDWPFIEEIFNYHGWPKNLRRTCGTIYFERDSQIRRYQDATGKFWKENAARQHHALVDARSLQVAWMFAMKR